jgi:hypothetical protein
MENREFRDQWVLEETMDREVHLDHLVLKEWKV